MNIKLLSEGAKVPTRAENGAAGYDLYVPYDIEVKPGRGLIPLDIQIELPKGTQGEVRPRSGFSLKGMEGFLPSKPDTPLRFDAHTILGTIDESYRGNIGVLIYSSEKESFWVKAGTRIAQLVITYYIAEPFEVTEVLSETDRGDGAYGHSGTH